LWFEREKHRARRSGGHSLCSRNQVFVQLVWF
jgi:hypothetical protein